MKRTDLPIQIQELLSRIHYATLATVCPDGQPWNSPVVGKFDAEMNLYWVSWQKNQHSQNVSRDPRIFVVVYDSQAPEGKGEGLYLQMSAAPLITQEEIDAARRAYPTDFFTHTFPHQQFLGDCPQRMYRADPIRIWYNADGDVGGHFVDVRRELTAKSS